ncbi:MAG: hypothetical protein WC911_02575 [Thermoleophilia bacterium]
MANSNIAGSGTNNAAATAGEMIIRTTNLHKTYDTGEVQVHALRGIDFEVMSGALQTEGRHQRQYKRNL